MMEQNGQIRKEPDEEAMLGEEFMQNGWEGLEQESQIRDEKKEQINEEIGNLNELYATVFDGEKGSMGRELLEDLLDRTLRQPVYGTQNQALFGEMLERIDDPDVKGRIREGQNQVVRFILARINQARTQGDN